MENIPVCMSVPHGHLDPLVIWIIMRNMDFFFFWMPLRGRFLFHYGSQDSMMVIIISRTKNVVDDILILLHYIIILIMRVVIFNCYRYTFNNDSMRRYPIHGGAL